MATGSSHQLYQTPVSCAICEGTEDVDSYCLMCKGPMCGTCVATHTRTPMFRKHEIVTLVEGLKQQRAEEEYEECNEHAKYIYSMHCNVCQKLICTECIISGEHSGHDIGGIEAALQRVKQEIKKYHDSLETNILPRYKTEKEKISKVKAECKKAAMSVKSDINIKRTELITEIHKVCDDMLSKVDHEEKQQSLQLDQSLHKVQDSIKETELKMTQSKDALTKLASEVIKFNKDKPSLSHLDGQEEAPIIHLPNFVPATINRENLAEHIGKLVSHNHPQFDTSILHREKVAEQAGNLVSPKHPQFDTSIIHRAQFDNRIHSINTVGENQAWVTSVLSTQLRLVNTGGTVVKSINTKFIIYDFAVTSSGEVIVTDYNIGCIRTITQTGQVKKTINTTPSRPTGVCLGKNGQDIVVCFYIPESSRSQLVVYNRDWKEIQTISYTDKPVKVYTSQIVTQNNRGDYCVAHRGHYKVYVVDTNGGLRWTYDGSGAGQLKKEFVPRDISSDIYNNVIISDTNNHKIHMLDGDGKFLRFILTEQNGISNPRGLCIDQDGRLWVGQENGGLCVVKVLPVVSTHQLTEHEN